MKPTLALTSCAVALALLLTGCGQTGPLYMPAPPAKAAPQTPSQAPAKPAAPAAAGSPSS